MDHSVLFVDDEAHILQSLRRLLRKEPYRLLTANSGEEGLEILASENIQLVISDQRMPGMEGTSFLSSVKDKWPDTVRVVFSGYADVSLIVDAINKGEVFRFLPKPWNDEELKTSIRQCLEHYDILEQNRRLLSQTRKQKARLEDMVVERTRSLQLSQEILEYLPVAVLGVSMEGDLVMSNEAAKRMIPRLTACIPGTGLDCVFPEIVVDEIMQKLSFEESDSIMKVELNSHLFSLHLRSMKNQRGGIVILQAEEEHVRP